MTLGRKGYDYFKSRQWPILLSVTDLAGKVSGERVALRERGVRLSAADFLAQAEHIRREHHEDLRRINAHSREELEQIRERRRDERDARRP